MTVTGPRNAAAVAKKMDFIEDFHRQSFTIFLLSPRKTVFLFFPKKNCLSIFPQKVRFPGSKNLCAQMTTSSTDEKLSKRLRQDEAGSRPTLSSRPAKLHHKTPLSEAEEEVPVPPLSEVEKEMLYAVADGAAVLMTTRYGADELVATYHDGDHPLDPDQQLIIEKLLRQEDMMLGPPRWCFVAWRFVKMIDDKTQEVNVVSVLDALDNFGVTVSWTTLTDCNPLHGRCCAADGRKQRMLRYHLTPIR